jgi:hypothetical protein
MARKLPEHLFTSSSDGCLYDTRKPDWSKSAPLRRDYCQTFSAIETAAQFKATLRNGAYAWPGGYPMHFICSDGESLCFACGRKELSNIIPAIRDKACDGWRVVATDINYEDSNLDCAHCSQPIESAYGDDRESD